jgi:hypothetical protein
MSNFSYEKQPWEEEIVGVDFSRRVPAGVTVNAVACGVTDVTLEETVGDRPGDYGGHIEISDITLTGVTGKEKILAAMISAGVAGFKYRISYRITLSDNQKKEDDVWVTVKET